MEQPVDIIEETGGLLASIAAAFIVCAVFWVVSSVLYRKILPAVLKRYQDKKRTVVYQIICGFRLPLATYLKATGIALALLIISQKLVTLALPASLLRFLASVPSGLGVAMRIATIVFFAWGLVLSSDVTGILLRRTRQRMDVEISQSVARFFSAVINVLVVAIAAVLILSELNFDINGLIAGLGLGGLTIALAAKDSASNFFGGLVLVTEKPFEIGDWISCADVEGTVEDINLRSTKVRTSTGSLTIVPNATLAAEPITNWGGVMEKRRADFNITLEYGTSNKNLKKFANSIEEMLTQHPDVVENGIIVRFTELADSGPNIRVVFYTAPTALADHLRVREQVNYEILNIAGDVPVTFAYPSQMVYVTPMQPAENTQIEKQP